jgi:hypothetical protein
MAEGCLRCSSIVLYWDVANLGDTSYDVYDKHVYHEKWVGI